MNKDKNQLMGLPGAAFSGIGSSIGVALVAYIGFIIAGAGKASIISILIGLSIGLFSGLPLYFLTKRMVIMGSSTALIEESLGKTIASLCTYSSVATIAFMSTYPVSIVNYIVSVFPALTPYRMILNFSVLVLAIATLCFGVKVFENSSKFFTMLLLLNLTLFVLLGLANIIRSGINPFDFSGDPIFEANGMTGVLSAVPLFAGTCTGFITIGYFGNLVNEPKKNVPKAILISASVMSFFWITLTIVAANILPVEEVAGQPLTYVARALMPDWLAAFFALTGPTMAILTTFIPGLQMTTMAIGLTASRGFLPRFLAPKDPTVRIHRSLIILIGVLIGLILLLDLPVNVIVANISPCISFAGSMIPTLSHVSIAFKHTELFDNKKDLTVYRIFALLGVVASTTLFILSVRAITPVSALVNIALIIVAYLFCAWKARQDAAKGTEAAAN